MLRAMSIRIKKIAAVVALATLAACASPGAPVPASHGSATAAWPLAEAAAVADSRVLLKSDDGPVGVLPTDFLRAANNAAQRVLAAGVGMRVEVLVTEGMQPNAFAFYRGGQPMIAINLAMVDLLSDDEAAWAALFGHEFAHFSLHHRQSRLERETTEEAGSGLIGLALSLAGIPFSSAIADTATTLVERSYTRDEERDADRLGVTYLLRAGYDPQGAVRLQEKLAAQGGGGSFLSTHPSGSERIEAMRRLVAEATRPAPASQ